jgi:uncharacterized protein (TIGR02099 family)
LPNRYVAKSRVNQDPFTSSEQISAVDAPRAGRLRRRLSKSMVIALAALTVLAIVVLIAFQIAVARVPQYRVQLQEWLSEKTHLSIESRALKARLRLYGPELAFTDVTVRSHDRTRVLATARGGSVAFDIWNSLRSGRLTAGRFTLDAPQLGLIRNRDGKILIAGQAESTKPFAVEHLPIGKFVVHDAIVSFQDEATGRGPWSLSSTRFTLERAPEWLEVAGAARLPTTLGASLQFSARVVGDLATPQRSASTLSLDGDALDLTGWADLLPDRWPAPESGRGSLHVTASFLGSRLQSVVAEAQFNELTASTPVWSLPLPVAEPLVLKEAASAERKHAREAKASNAATPESSAPAASAAETPGLLSYERVRMKVRAERDKAGWRAQVTSLELDATETPQNKAMDWQSRNIELAWAAPVQGALKVSGKADVILLEGIAPLLAYLPESKALAHLRALNLRGTVLDLSFDADRPAADAPLKYSAAGATDAMGFDPVLKVPGVTGITGSFQASHTGGEFKLDTGPLHMSIPWMFRWPLDTNAIRGVVTWRDDGKAWLIGSEALHFDANDGKGQAKLAIRAPHDGTSPQLDISAQARDMRAAATRKYLPANRLGPQALAWLDRAFVDGRVPRGSLELHGPARAFPFRNGEGTFLAQGYVENITFDYQPGWTPATLLTGNVEFRNEGMHASGITAQIGALQVTQASGGFADFKQGDLKIAAAATGDLDAALEFLQSSPLAAALGEQFGALRGEGSLESNVSLLLPITHVDDRRISVVTKLANASVRLTDLDAPVTQLNGSLIVRQELPVEADLTGQWLGGPLYVLISPDDRTDQSATLVARGRASANELDDFLPTAVKLSGAMDWRMTTRLSSRMESGPQVYAIDSSVQGLGLALPYPVGKAPESTRPLHIELEQAERQLLARASFGGLRALLRFAPSRGGWVLDRGGVRADEVLAALPDHPGLRVEGSIDRLRLDEWFALGESAAAASKPATENPNASKLSEVLRAVNLHVGLLQLYGYEWPDVRGVMQSTEQGWRVDVTGANAEGQLLIPYAFAGSQPLTIDLERLVVMRIAEAGNDAPNAATKGDPREWPSLQVHIGDLHVENHPIGGVDLVTSRMQNGMRIDSLAIAQDAVQAEARGDWLITPEGERSSLEATITSTDVRATLRALNYTEFLEAERAQVSAQLTWPGGFDATFVKRASGAITVAADKGQLLTLQPGAGRVLGLFSVAALPRRLSLDFSDITEEGLGFDTIHGDFALREGNAYTSNLLLRGPAAEIGVAGRTGLGSQDFDQTAIVTGNLGASIPVAGVLAGGPAVGAALLLFSQVFKEPLKGIARGYYRITGTWDEPLVERVDAAEAKEKG